MREWSGETGAGLSSVYTKTSGCLYLPPLYTLTSFINFNMEMYYTSFLSMMNNF